MERKKKNQLCFSYMVLFFPSTVARGSILGVAKEEDQTSVTVSLTRLYRQKTQVFVSGGGRAKRWTGFVKMPRQCGVKPGEGEFLFTGTVRFGEAWLSCAPRYKDFLRMYQDAQQQGTNPCHLDTDWILSRKPHGPPRREELWPCEQLSVSVCVCRDWV